MNTGIPDNNSLVEFNERLKNEVRLSNDSCQEYLFERFITMLNESGDPDNFDEYVYYDNEKMRVDGYYWERNNNKQSTRFHLFISEFDAEFAIQSLNSSDIKRLFQKSINFFKHCAVLENINMWDPAYSHFSLGMHIYDEVLPLIETLKITLLTNKSVNIRSDKFETQKLKISEKEIDVVFGKFDLEDYFRFEGSGELEPLVIDFTEYDQQVKCINVDLINPDVTSYMAVIPGKIVADIFQKFGSRLLEQNVRSFLSIRGHVNKNMLGTIENNSKMFFAYNNGLTITADDVVVKNGLLHSITNIQVVNGGQTSNTLLYAKKSKNLDLKDTFLQAKISIINKEKYEKIVPLISRFSNTQNTVRKSDFFSSHPFHTKMHELSKEIWAPQRTDDEATYLNKTKWFYENRRGAWENPHVGMTQSEKKKWRNEFPRTQVLDKRILSRCFFAFDGKPYISQKGNEISFQKFSELATDQWEKSRGSFVNKVFFKKIVSQNIVWRDTQNIIKKSEWYKEKTGNLATLYTYTVAMLAYLLKKKDKELDFDEIWKTQTISMNLNKIIHIISKKIFDLIYAENYPMTARIDMDSRKEYFFKWLMEQNFDVPEQLLRSVAKKTDEAKEDEREGVVDETENSRAKLQIYVHNNWEKIEELLVKNNLYVPPLPNALLNARRGNINNITYNLIIASLEKLKNLGIELPDEM